MLLVLSRKYKAKIEEFHLAINKLHRLVDI